MAENRKFQNTKNVALFANPRNVMLHELYAIDCRKSKIWINKKNENFLPFFRIEYFDK